MAKINITKPTNEVEVLALLSAFKADNNTYIIFDSERIGSMGLPIIYISKYTDKLEKITDTDEWQNVKNYLKGIINGTSFEYIKVDENLISDEAYYTPLTLPTTSFDTIKNRYVVVDNSTAPVLEPINEIPATPVMPDNNVVPSTEVIAPNFTAEPVVETKTIEKESNANFDMDKETFLKACENMFDALVSKYQKELTDLERREKELAIKEQEISNKMASASEALANAEAKEQVANIAHDNAQKVMDLSSIMPHPTDTQTGVI